MKEDELLEEVKRCNQKFGCRYQGSYRLDTAFFWRRGECTDRYGYSRAAP